MNITMSSFLFYYLAFIPACLLVVKTFYKLSNRTPIPLVNAPRWFEPQTLKRFRFLKHGEEIISESRRRYIDKPFRVLTQYGETLILPPQSVHLVRNKPFDFGEHNRKASCFDIPGLEPAKVLSDSREALHYVIKDCLTKHLHVATKAVSNEASYAIDLGFGQPSDWKHASLESFYDIVFRASSRIFVGDKMCRNNEWLKITKTYALYAGMAITKLWFLPSVFEGFFGYFSSDCRNARRALQRAREIMNSVVEERRNLKVTARAKGDASLPYQDAIEWAEAYYDGRPYDLASLQLGFIGAGIHSTADLLVQTLLHLANKPEFIEDLREEIIIFAGGNCTKDSLQSMTLLDSAIKEAQRLKPIGMLTMNRLATADVQLPCGIMIRKNDLVGIDMSNMKDPKVYPEPEKYDIFRFKRMRDDPVDASKAQLVTTSTKHLGFGYGKSACPGRFFAANQIKIILCHLLLKYDWKLAPETSTVPTSLGIGLMVNPATRFLYKRRTAEVNLDNMEFV